MYVRNDAVVFHSKHICKYSVKRHVNRRHELEILVPPNHILFFFLH